LVRKFRSVFILTVTVALLYLVFRKVGIAELFETLRGANVYWVMASISIAPLTILVSILKWQILLRSQGIHVTLPRLFALYIVGRFFNNFLPSTVGGDLVRGYELGNYTNDGAAAMASVFMERFTGFVVLIGMAVISFLTQRWLINQTELTIAMGLAIAGLLILLWLMLDTRPLSLIRRWLNFPLAHKYIPKLEKFHRSLNAYRDHKRALAWAIVFSFAFMALAILNVYASARAFHQPVSFVQIAIIVPVILVVAMLPLTFNGLGLQEWAYVLLFTWIGLPATVGLSTIILIRGKDLVTASLGGLFYPWIKISRSSAPQRDRQEIAEPVPQLRENE
jgi:glycosyltransferase 2 family protein